MRAGRITVAYAAAAVVMAAASVFEAGFGARAAHYTPFNIGTALATGLCVLVARWSPVGGIVVLTLAVGIPALATDGLPPVGGSQLIAWMLLVGNAAYRMPRSRSLATYAVSVVVPPLAIVLQGESLWEFIFFALILAPAWVVGYLLRREQERSRELAALAEELRAEREKQAEVAVAAERTRISRELHDAVAHTVSVMTLQVGVVRRRQLPGSVEEETLRRAETMGRQAVDELRRIVGIVREGESAALAPLPSLSQLDELVGQVRRTGTSVSLEVEGEVVEVPPAVGMSAYRIVQEGLTNALRHAPGSWVAVRLDVAGGAIGVVVENGPARKPIGHHGPGGHGLVGVRERAHVLGGTFESGPLADGGFRLAARLPFAVAAGVTA